MFARYALTLIALPFCVLSTPILILGLTGFLTFVWLNDGNFRHTCVGSTYLLSISYIGRMFKWARYGTNYVYE